MFYTNYTRLCNEAKMSLSAVASECGVKSTGTVSGWANGSKPSRRFLVSIADFFTKKLGRTITVEDLVGDTNPSARQFKFSVQDSLFSEIDIRRITDQVIEGLKQETEKPATETGNGLSEEELDLIRLYRSSQPRIRKAMLDLLRSAEAGQSTPDASGANR